MEHIPELGKEKEKVQENKSDTVKNYTHQTIPSRYRYSHLSWLEDIYAIRALFVQSCV